MGPAIAELQRVMRMFPDFPQVEAILGVFYMDAGDTARAFEYFREKERTHPTSDLYYYEGITLGTMGRIDEAVAKLLKAGEIDPDETQAYKAAYMLLMDHGRREEAAQVLRTLIEKHPEDPEVQAYLQQGDTSRRRSWAGQGAPGQAPSTP
jgi:tetratricopeptide (TPR) repeat protein